jgi:mannosyltransferase OCH1-like enzyme
MLNTTPAQGLLKNHFVNPPTNLSIDWNTPQTTASAFNVPRSIHYVWVGENCIPDSALRNIYRMHQTNCSQKSLDSFKIFVWTDNPKRILNSMYNAEKSDDLILSQLARNSNKDGKITVKHYSVLVKCAENKDIADHKVKLYLDGLVTRNLYGPFRNYACASDILRLFALNLGGIYLDVDVSVIDKIPVSCLTSEHGLRNYYKNSMLFNNVMIAAPNDWVVKNALMFICEQHVTLNTRYSGEYLSVDSQLNVTWHQQRWFEEYTDPIGNKHNLRKDITINLTGPYLYSYANANMYGAYRQAHMDDEETLITARNHLTIAGNSEQINLLNLDELRTLGRDLKLKSLISPEEFSNRYFVTSDIFNNYEDSKEYSKPLDINNFLKSSEENKHFFAHGIVKGVAPSGDSGDNLDSWCKVDANIKHHDTSDIPVAVGNAVINLL